jgi:hypothetical protein
MSFLLEVASGSGRGHLGMQRRGALSVARVTPYVVAAKGQWPAHMTITMRKEPQVCPLMTLLQR